MNTTNTTMNNKASTATINEKLSTIEILSFAKYFLPILTTLGWVMGFGFNPPDGSILMILSFALIGIGLVSALCVCPIKLLTFPLKCVAKGFVICRSFIPVYGVADLCAAIFGTIFGFVFGSLVVLAAPAIFTIKKLLDGNNRYL